MRGERRWARSRDYDAANQLNTEVAGASRTTYSYDNCGNRTQKAAVAAVTFYTWDEQNRLREAEPPAGPVTLTYNARGRRVGKQAAGKTKQFLYDFEKVLRESDGDGVPLREYTSTAELYGSLLSEFDQGQSRFFQYDGLGSTDALLNANEFATDRFTYRAFGLEAHTGSGGSSGGAALPSQLDFMLGSLPSGGSTTPNTDRTFVGRQGYTHDRELDFYFVNERYYDFAAGRWTSEDRGGYPASGVNLFLYCNNNPVNQIDPSGQSPNCFTDPDSLAACSTKALLQPAYSEGAGLAASFQDAWKAVPVPVAPRPSNRTDDLRACIGFVRDRGPDLLRQAFCGAFDLFRSQLRGEGLLGALGTVGDILGKNLPKSDKLSDKLAFVLDNLDHPCIRLSPGFNLLAKQVLQYREGTLKLVGLIEEFYRHPEKYLGAIKDFLGKQFARLSDCLSQAWAKFKETGQQLFKGIGGMFGQVFRVLAAMVLETLSGVVEAAVNTSWDSLWQGVVGTIKELLDPRQAIQTQWNKLEKAATEAGEAFYNLMLDKASQAMEKALEAALAIIDKLGFYLYLLLVGAPTLIGTVVPVKGNAVGFALGQKINSFVAVALRALNTLLDGLKGINLAVEIYNIVEKRAEEQREEGYETPACTLPEVVFTDDDIKVIVTKTLDFVERFFPNVTGLALSVLGTSAASVGKGISDKVLKGTAKARDTIIQRVLKRCATCYQSKKKKACFPAGTLVKTATGYRAIELIAPDDWVWARHVATGAWQLARVAETLWHEYDGDLVTLTAGGEPLTATGGHPFWVTEGEGLPGRPVIEDLAEAKESAVIAGRWVSARDLRAGDILVSRTAERVAVELVAVWEERLATFNLQVEGLHTYTVGEIGLWVHNASPEGKKPRPCKDAPKGTLTPEESAAIDIMKGKKPSSYEGSPRYKDDLGFPIRHSGVAPGHLAKQTEVANDLIKQHGLTVENGLVLYNKPLKSANDPFATGNNAIRPDVQVFKKTPSGWERVGKPVEIEPKGGGFQHKKDKYKENGGGSFEAVEY